MTYDEILTDILTHSQTHLRLGDEQIGRYFAVERPVSEAVAKRIGAEQLLSLKGERFYEGVADAILDLPQQIAAQHNLLHVTPPGTVHWVGRPTGVFFDFRNSDVLLEAVNSAGMSVDEGSYLDFGCSSGRTVRTLAAAYPQARWIGADPVEKSIVWARNNLKEARFILSEELPPLLGLRRQTLNGAFAQSVWSHFSERHASRWFAEMRRKIRPGGFLCFSAQGYHDIALKARRRGKPRHLLLSALQGLRERGFAYAADGLKASVVHNPDWGSTWMTREWLERQVAPMGWRVGFWAPGRWGHKQDVYVLV